MQIPAALRSVTAALLHGPVVTRFALRLQSVADNAKIRLRAGRGRGAPASTTGNKSKGTIAVSAGKKMTFDE